MLSIGKLARQSGVKVPTIRYYESTGILDKPARSAGNQRQYTEYDLERLNFIKHARTLGFPIDSIRELIELSQHPGKRCDNADKIAIAQLEAVRDRIQRLQKLETELARIATHCDGHDVDSCYVIQALGDHDLCSGEH